MEKVTIAALQAMKRGGKKIVGTVVYDYPTAQIADRAGMDLVSVGDSVGMNLWGHATESEITVEEMLIACKAVRRGVKRALISCDVPQGAVGEGAARATSAAARLTQDGGANMVKVLGSAELVRAIVRAGIPVFAEFHGGKEHSTGKLVDEAKRLEDAGASMLDFRHSGPEAGAAVVSAVSIPVIGGIGGGPWLDGRMRVAHTAIGWGTKWLDSTAETYANTSRVALQALTAMIEDVRAGRQIKG